MTKISVDTLTPFSFYTKIIHQTFFVVTFYTLTMSIGNVTTVVINTIENIGSFKNLSYFYCPVNFSPYSVNIDTKVVKVGMNTKNLKAMANNVALKYSN